MLNAVAFRFGRMIARGWIDEKTVADALLEACDANKYLREHGHRATMKTIESGIESGRKEPHPDLPDREPSSGGDGPAASELSELSGLSGLSGIRGAKQGISSARSSWRGAVEPKLAHGRSQIGRSSMTGEVICLIFR